MCIIIFCVYAVSFFLSIFCLLLTSSWCFQFRNSVLTGFDSQTTKAITKQIQQKIPNTWVNVINKSTPLSPEFQFFVFVFILSCIRKRLKIPIYLPMCLFPCFYICILVRVSVSVVLLLFWKVNFKLFVDKVEQCWKQNKTRIKVVFKERDGI